MTAAGISPDFKSQVRQSTKLQFGNYQVDGVISAAKKLGISPRCLAKKVLAYLDLDIIANKIKIAGPGFINIFLNPKFLASKIDIALKSDRLGVSFLKAQTVVVDYSAPNVAKEMHVGHLRSTIIGDAVVRTMEFLGHNVIRANHVGDWGTQFGMLITYLEEHQKNIDKMTLTDLERSYCEAQKIFDEDKLFAIRARDCVVRLQSGELQFLKIWRKLVDITMSQNQIIYNRLNVTLTHRDIMGESLYNSMLPGIVSDLKEKGLAVESEGATVVFLNEYKNKKGYPTGVIIQKRDGGYLYSTTDIACANYRYKILHADRVLYYTDSRQHQHLIQVWAIARKAGYVPDSVSLEHHMFGMILGKDGKPFKTRKGDTIKLSSLLDEALERARHLVSRKNPDMSLDELEKVANAVSVGAVKYADLSKNRTTEYIFDWDNILVFEGNTALYIQYAYTRILSIFRKANVDEKLLVNAPVILGKDYEIQLAVKLLQLEEILIVVARDGVPHVICSYLYDLADLFSHFYEQCPILSAKNNDIIKSRLKLVKLTARTIKLCLDILGIETIERL